MHSAQKGFRLFSASGESERSALRLRLRNSLPSREFRSTNQIENLSVMVDPGLTDGRKHLAQAVDELHVAANGGPEKNEPNR